MIFLCRGDISLTDDELMFEKITFGDFGHNLLDQLLRAFGGLLVVCEVCEELLENELFGLLGGKSAL